MIRYKSGSTQTIAKKRASEMLEGVNEEFQRRLSSSHVQHLAHLLKHGEFIATGNIVSVRINGEKRIANGMHTLHAIVVAETPARCLVEEFVCDSDAEYVKLFHAYDTENRKRTFVDSARAFLMGRPGDLPDVNETTLNMFRSGAEYAYRASTAKHRHHNVTRYERFDQLTHLRDEFDFYVELGKQKDCREVLDRAPIVAAVINTYRACPDSAEPFWGQVVSGFYAVQGDTAYPPVVLNKFLRSHTIHGGGYSRESAVGRVKSNSRSVGRAEMYAGCIRAWNAYMEGRPLRQLKTAYKGGAPRPMSTLLAEYEKVSA